MSGIQLFRLREGQIIERWGVFDREGVMRQIGVD
jgi:predicted ester cyclase